MAAKDAPATADLTDEELSLLSPAVQALAADFKHSGWTPMFRRPSYGIRYWCPGPCRHQAWLPLAEKTPTTIDRLRLHLDSMKCFVRKETA